MLDEHAGISGILRAYERPRYMPRDAFARGGGHLVAEASNVITNQWWVDAWGMGAGSAVAPVAQILALGNGASPAPTRFDTGLIAETVRLPMIGSTISTADPPSTTLSFFSPAGDGVYTVTEAGLFYYGATVTLGSGRCMSHVAFSYSKAANTDVRYDYLLQRSTLT